MFLLGLALFGVASAVCAAAPTVGLLVAGRTAQALAAALLAPSSLALLLPAFPPERRGFAVGTWGAMGGIAAATGPALGGLVVDVLGWRAVFLLNLPVVVLTLVAATVVMAESRDRGARLPDPAGVLLLGVGVALLAWGIVGGETSWTAPATLARLVGGLGLLAVFAWRSARVATPLVEPALFRVRAFRAAIVGYLVFSAAFYALLLANVLFLTGVWHYAVLTAGLAVTPGTADGGDRLGGGRAAGGPVRGPGRARARRAAVRDGLRACSPRGMGGDPAYLTHFLPATLLTGTGVGAVFSGLGVATVAALPPNRYATGSAVGTCARQIGAVFGISALLSGLAAGGEFRTAWVLMAIAALATAAVGRHRRPGARRPDPRPDPRDDRRDRMTTQLTRERTYSWTDPARDRGRRPGRRRVDVPARARRGRDPARPDRDDPRDDARGGRRGSGRLRPRARGVPLQPHRLGARRGLRHRARLGLRLRRALDAARGRPLHEPRPHR